MKTLSIQQPWAWLIFERGKDIENRTWNTNFRGWLQIHAGQKYDEAGAKWVKSTLGLWVPDAESLPRGGIVGTVAIINVVTKSRSRWFCGPFGWVIDPIKVFACHFEQCRGQQGLFEYPERVAA